MAQFTFQELIRLLPPCEVFPTDSQLPRGVSHGTMIPEFTPPDVSLSEGDLHSSQVLIVAAAGAVGKSTLARALSSQTGALIWDLADAEEVGFGSLDAMLERAMQSGMKSHFLEWMAEGIQFIIIDALDEGRIKVNENSFARLIENISRLANAAKGICFVLLGRTQIAETVWLSLTDQATTASLLTIEPFTREQANEYIRKRVDCDETKLFIECRDLIFEQLEAPIRDSPDSQPADDFLHYPPVLDVISVVLNRERNLIALKNFLESQTPQTSAILLRNVIDHILEREQQEKVVPAFLDNIAAEHQDFLLQHRDFIYTSSEQGHRLLSSVLNVPAACSPSIIPLQLEATYNSAVTRALTEHPFLRGVNRFANSVFESYLYARALREDFGSELAIRVADVLSSASSLPTRLLAEFYLNTDSDHISSRQRVRPEHIGLLYDSLLSSESSRRRVRLTIDGSDPIRPDGSDAEGEFELVAIDREGEVEYEPQLIPFTLQLDGDSKISFRRFIKDLHLTAPCTVELGSKVAEFKIGPPVHITASRIIMGSEDLVVERALSKFDEYVDTSVTLETQSFESPLMSGSPTVYAHDFSVSWPGDEAFPWRMYRRDQVATTFHDERSQRAYLRFRRIVNTFQSRGKGALARAKVKIEGPRVMQGSLGVALLGKLMGDGILHLGDGGRRYFWNPQKANDLLGVSWIDLRKGDCPEKLRHYLSEFIELNPDL